MIQTNDFDKFIEWSNAQQRRAEVAEEELYNLEQERLKWTEKEAKLQEELYHMGHLLKEFSDVIEGSYDVESHSMTFKTTRDQDLFTENLLAIRSKYIELKQKYI